MDYSKQELMAMIALLLKFHFDGKVVITRQQMVEMMLLNREYEIIADGMDSSGDLTVRLKETHD